MFVINWLAEILTAASPLLPGTVVVAIFLFFLKEGLESRRRYKGNERKRRALRRLIADEIERNNFQIRRMRQCLLQVERSIQKNGSEIRIVEGYMGEILLKTTDDGGYYQSPLGATHGEVLAENLMEFGLIDGKFFEAALETSDAVKELEHIRRSMMQIIADGENYLLETFIEYAREEIDESEEILSKFYTNLTGNDLIQTRVR